MKIRSLAAAAVLAAVPAAILTTTAVTSASSAAPVAHTRTLTAARLAATYDAGNSGYTYRCDYYYYKNGVWTGSEMVIWQNYSCAEGDYDFNTDTGWLLVSTN